MSNKKEIIKDQKSKHNITTPQLIEVMVNIRNLP